RAVDDRSVAAGDLPGAFVRAVSGHELTASYFIGRGGVSTLMPLRWTWMIRLVVLLGQWHGSSSRICLRSSCVPGLSWRAPGKSARTTRWVAPCVSHRVHLASALPNSLVSDWP